MPATMPSSTRIFEDPQPRRHHKRVPSVGDVLRGRRMKDKESQEPEADGAARHTGQNPLGERHLNSPPPRRGFGQDDVSRPSMHKKTNSSISLKGFMKSKEKPADCGSMSSSDGRNENHKPKKTKSSTNLAGLLRKK